MIKKITEIKNVGKFENYKSSDINLGKFVGVFADNGSGKSTLTNIFRSFSENNPKILTGRKTISSGGPISCKIETDTGFKKFTNDSWDLTESNILIFDAHFINQNIYSGMHVGIDQRRKLYQFILGEEAIHLNEEVNSIAQMIFKKNQDMNEKKKELNKVIGKDIQINDFISLPKIENVEDAITAKSKEVNALGNRDKVTKQSSLYKISIPDYSMDDVKSLLLKSIKDLSKSSEEKVNDHIKKCLNEKGEDWIKQGLSISSDSEDCPYCGVDIKSNELIKAYSDFFNDSYTQLKDEITTHKKTFTSKFNQAFVEKAKKSISDNDGLVEFWNQYVPTSLLIEDQSQGDYFPILEKKDLQEFFDKFSSELKPLLEEKFIAPLEELHNDPRFTSAVSIYNQFIKQIESYNNLVDSQNSLIQVYKDALGSSDLGTEKQSLKRLTLTRERFDKDTDTLCKEYSKLSTDKDALVIQKDTAKNKLDTETQKIPNKYQEKINYYLERFGTEFRIADHKKVNPSGQSATEYKLVLKGVEIILGDNKTPEEITSFQNTLSEGDKSTLAFSYFLARLDSDSDLSKKILVFDDPISSRDRFRRSWTRSILKQFGHKSKQLIILSHEPSFMEDLAHTLRGTDFKCLNISWDSERNSSILEIADIKKLNRNDYIRNLEKVKNYLKANIGSPEDIKARLRHLLEHYIRNKYPQSFFKKDNLGNMIRTLRESEPEDEYSQEKDILNDLDAINEYSIDENHAQDGDSGPIDIPELMALSKLTFKIIDEPVPS